MAEPANSCCRGQEQSERCKLWTDAKVKGLTANAFGRCACSTLPSRPKDVEDDGAFHYAGLGQTPRRVQANTALGRFLDETTGGRVYIATPLFTCAIKDGLGQLYKVRVTWPEMFARN